MLCNSVRKVGALTLALGTFIGTAQAQPWVGQLVGYTEGQNSSIVQGPVTPACVPIELFTGNGNGTAPNDDAWTKAITFLNTHSGGNGCIAFGAGKYRFNNAATATYTNASRQAISVVGAGADATVLYFPNATDGLVLNMGASPSPAFHLRGISITSAAAVGTQKTGLIVTDSTTGWGGDATSSSIDDVTIRPDNTLQSTPSFGWFNGASFTGVGQVNVHGLTLLGVATKDASGHHNGGYGVGLQFQGNGLNGYNPYAVALNFDQLYVQAWNLGVLYGNWVQGVAISNSNIQQNVYGIQTGIYPGSPPGMEQPLLGQLSVTNSQIATYNNAVSFQTGIAATLFSNNLIMIAPNSAGIICAPCGGLIATGNTFSGPGPVTGPVASIGIMDSSPQSGAVLVTGNLFTLLDTGFASSTDVKTCNVQSNIYHVVNHWTSSFGTCTIGGGSP